MPIRKNSRIQYSINTTFPFILPTLKFVNKNSSRDLKRSDVRSYVVANFSQGKSPKSEMDIVSKIIDRYLEEIDKKIILGDLGAALLKTWEKYPQTRNELLIIGFSQHFIVEFTLKEVHKYLIKGTRKISGNDLKKKIKSLDLYPKLAKNIENNITEILKDLIRLKMLPEKENNRIYNIDYYQPTDLGLLYYILYYFPERITISLKSLDQSDLLEILLTDIINLKNAFERLSKKNLVKFESFADVQKYVIKIKTIKELNERI